MTIRPTLSFCITSRGPSPRLRALLEVVRPHVDEVVLAADRNGDPDVLDACADLADRRLTFELERSPVWLAPWAMHQCRCDWILRLDDDEVPSSALLAALPELIADRYPTVIRFDRRWLFGGRDRYITSFPWSFERQARLVRNIPSLWRFEGRVHMGGDWLGEVRTTELAMYHLVLLTSSAEARRARREWYEGLVPALAIEEFSLEDMYVPEDAGQLDSASVPEEDLPLIDRVLDGSVAGPNQEGAPVEDASLQDVAFFNTDRPTSERAYEAAIAFTFARPEALPGALRHYEVRVENRGDEVWRWSDARSDSFLLGWRWRDLRSGKAVPGEGRVPFPETVRPGQETIVPMLVRTPGVPGPYELEIDVVHEHVRWFGCEATLPVLVDRAARDGNAGPTGHDRTAADSLARAHEAVEAERLAAAAFRGTRRYRLASALAMPLERLRAGLRGSGRMR